MKESLKYYILDVRELIAKTGSFILEESKGFNKGDVEEKGKNDLVSYVDKTAESMLVDGLKKILPDAGFLTEEGTASLDGDLQWIIDPLDGTTNFVHSLPVFSISVALHLRGELILGVVHELNKNECFHAIWDQPAFLNENEISVSSTTSLADSLLATGFPYYDFDNIDRYLKLLKSYMKSTHGLRRLGSAAVDLAYVSCGRFEGFFEYNLNAWDVAAGAFLVKQAGGKVTDFSGGDSFLFGREIVAGNIVVDEMLDVIKNHWN